MYFWQETLEQAITYQNLVCDIWPVDPIRFNSKFYLEESIFSKRIHITHALTLFQSTIQQYRHTL